MAGLILSNLISISPPHHFHYFDSPRWQIISNSGLGLSIATNAVTTMMIAYKLWYVAVNETYGSSGAHHEGIFREHRIIILKTLGPSRRKSPVQTILILLVESGLVYLTIQVSPFGIVFVGKVLKVLTLLTDSVPRFRRAYAPRGSFFIWIVWRSEHVFLSCRKC